MTSDEKAIEAAASLGGKMLDIAKDSPDAREAGANLAAAAKTVTALVKHSLLPIAALNFGMEKAAAYFREKFANDVEGKTRHIPAESVVEPKASIAGPILQGLAFSHDEDKLKELYLELLASAMDKRRTGGAHPAFVEVIRQLSAEEIQALTAFLASDGSTPIAEIRERSEGSSYATRIRFLLDLTKGEGGEPVVLPSLAMWVDNWVRLGLATTSFTERTAGEDAYAWVETRPEYLAIKTDRIFHQPGLMEPTTFGMEFARSVGMIPT